MLVIAVYIPDEALDEVKEAMFAAGAGVIGNYDSCAWQTKGEGQFRPLDGSQPYLGRQGEIEKVVEYKVELVCDEQNIKQVLQAMIAAHPYEEPAYHVFDGKTLSDFC